MIAENYSLDEAAQLLRCFPRYLKDNLDKLPHQKIGAAVVFDASELEAIKEMHRVRPAEQPETAPTATSVLTLAGIKPSQGRRKTG
ncbi:hypothetical protein ACWGDX_02885 [Streptomyces sp. NPDC055025]